MRNKAEAAKGSRARSKGGNGGGDSEAEVEDQEQQGAAAPPACLDHGFPVRTKGPLCIHLVPYSEHSSYTELIDFVRWLRPKQVRQAPRECCQHPKAQRRVPSIATSAAMISSGSVRLCTVTLEADPLGTGSVGPQC